MFTTIAIHSSTGRSHFNCKKQQPVFVNSDFTILYEIFKMNNNILILSSHFFCLVFRPAFEQPRLEEIHSTRDDLQSGVIPPPRRDPRCQMLRRGPVQVFNFSLSEKLDRLQLKIAFFKCVETTQCFGTVAKNIFWLFQVFLDI